MASESIVIASFVRAIASHPFGAGGWQADPVLARCAARASLVDGDNWLTDSRALAADEYEEVVDEEQAALLDAQVAFQQAFSEWTNGGDGGLDEDLFDDEDEQDSAEHANGAQTADHAAVAPPAKRARTVDAAGVAASSANSVAAGRKKTTQTWRQKSAKGRPVAGAAIASATDGGADAGLHGAYRPSSPTAAPSDEAAVSIGAAASGSAADAASFSASGAALRPGGPLLSPFLLQFVSADSAGAGVAPPANGGVSAASLSSGSSHIAPAARSSSASEPAAAAAASGLGSQCGPACTHDESTHAFIASVAAEAARAASAAVYRSFGCVCAVESQEATASKAAASGAIGRP